MDNTIRCELCGKPSHSIHHHLLKEHPGVTLEEYQRKFPDAPVLSEMAKQELAKKQQPAVVDLHAAAAAVGTTREEFVPRQDTVQNVFKVALAALNGEAIKVTCYKAPASLSDLVPDIDPKHWWGDGEDLRLMLMALETNMPLYVYGHKGTGKTTDITQICALTGRPLLRVQHTRNTEESHILGQWTLVGGQTSFELGPLATAMREGMVYLADEYDVAQPGALAVYQPVLEGEPLVIKEAPRHLRVIKPHPLFRFVATGNTNGTGDETGLYAGTMIQNSANYDRFQMAIEKQYMPPKHEVEIIVGRTGLRKQDAEKLVQMANEVRTNFAAGKMSDTVSTRSLVTIATIGRRRANMGVGVKYGWSNKLNAVDRTAVNGMAQRHWG